MMNSQYSAEKATQDPVAEVELHDQMRPDVIRVPAKKARRILFIILSVLTAAAGVYTMYDILAANGLTTLEGILLVLFSVTFCWIAMAFWSGLFGFILQMLKRDPLTLGPAVSPTLNQSPLTTRTAVVMPVYNEDITRVIAGFEATLRSLEDTGEIAHFDFYLLSDTTSLYIAQNERNAWAQLQDRLGPIGQQCFYRRREKNIGRKVGNLSDFCQRWGSNYEHMIVLDADSVMNGDTLLTLVRTMEANPRAGLVQTVPIPVRQTTFFGRFVQFAAVLYSPMLATGIAFWQAESANYWGHNAIIRVRAFMDHCGLPTLEGKAPFGGDILSHDFVEAALLRRAGWRVLLLSDLGGSFEEVPCNIIDYAKRDRRWVQGNIQHLGLLKLPDLHPISRLHFFMGAIAYITSFIWLMMLVLSTADAVIRALHANVYFTGIYQLYPSWPIDKTPQIAALIILTITLLMGPKLLAIILTITHRRQEFGGTRAIIKGSIIETLFAILIAPIMMSYHAWFVLSVFLGFKVNWDAQDREGRMLPWGESIARTSRMTILALLWGWVTYTYAPIFFWWLLPITTGMVLSSAIVRYSSSLDLGTVCRENGIFVCPDETNEPDVLTRLRELQAEEYPPLEQPADTPALPPENWRDMPHPPLTQYYRAPFARR
ncbi:glucans biosynthesis glucosyltransferase MdoH [Parathalassolituus penaei]|uniref:Glucans biosynthesis glucosyltransferase H n=1 Tax=Parathalassolituus penaei TaxID=2997323 RepID=A0A9X3ENP4_9GAMM|nr:glucans biosynthesis glucosyltransferase MdoH [Parathalassolituus penaei]MCY0966028.1 glucans biosynthesis glucosyltransferase MdoH [Parathalassolituus penaei]